MDAFDLEAALGVELAGGGVVGEHAQHQAPRARARACSIAAWISALATPRRRWSGSTLRPLISRTCALAGSAAPGRA